MSKKYNPSDADDNPPPAYQEVVDPPFNPNFPSSSQQSTPQPPHTPDVNHHYQQQQLYPQIPTMPSPPISFPQPQHYQQQQQQQQIQPHQQHGNNQVRYQAIEIPQNNLLRERRRRHTMESRKFPLAAIFFLFGWFCPPLWIIGACCCAGSRNAYESFWGKVNFLMAMILIVTSLIYSGFAMSQYYM